MLLIRTFDTCPLSIIIHYHWVFHASSTINLLYCCILLCQAFKFCSEFGSVLVIYIFFCCGDVMNINIILCSDYVFPPLLLSPPLCSLCWPFGSSKKFNSSLSEKDYAFQFQTRHIIYELYILDLYVFMHMNIYCLDLYSQHIIHISECM